MKTSSTLLFFAVATAAMAQTKPAETGIEKGTFGMAKATLEFLATDQKTFGVTKKPVCEGCKTYPDLAAFIKANNLKKADGLVNDIKKHSLLLTDDFAADAFTSEGAVLDSLRRYVVTRITSGSERAHRTKLASFPAYQTRMTALSGGADPEQAVNEQAAAGLEGEGETPLAAEPATASNGTSLGTWAFWLSLLNLIGLGYLLFTRLRGQSPAATDREDARLAGLQDENNRLSSTVADLSNRLTIAEKKIMQAPQQAQPNRPAERAAPLQQAVERGPVYPNPAPPEPPRRDVPVERGPLPASGSVGNQPRPGYGNPANPVIPPNTQQAQSSLRPTPVVLPVNPGTLAGPSEEMPPPTAPPTAPAMPVVAKKLYARTADLGNGFSVSGLLEEAERGIVYEIELTSPGTALYRVSQSPESQQLAMSDPYSYLSDACLYENQPGGPNSRIQTVAPGQLTLQGDKWQITGKARVGFL